MFEKMTLEEKKEKLSTLVNDLSGLEMEWQKIAKTKKKGLGKGITLMAISAACALVQSQINLLQSQITTNETI